jgi:hypothetical protein
MTELSGCPGATCPSRCNRPAARPPVCHVPQTGQLMAALPRTLGQVVAGSPPGPSINQHVGFAYAGRLSDDGFAAETPEATVRSPPHLLILLVHRQHGAIPPLRSGLLPVGDLPPRPLALLPPLPEAFPSCSRKSHRLEPGTSLVPGAGFWMGDGAAQDPGARGNRRRVLRIHYREQSQSPGPAIRSPRSR